MRVMIIDPGFQYSTLAIAESFFDAFVELGYETHEYDTLRAFQNLCPLFKKEGNNFN